jgi:HEAT repeat protein
VKVEDLEHTIVQAFPMEILLPTSVYVFDELTRLNEELADHPDHPVLLERLSGVKRILKWVSERVVKEGVSGSEPFLQQLYNHQILTFEELPEVVQDHINTLKIVDHFKNDSHYYMNYFIQASGENDMLLMLRFFRRILPHLMEDGSYKHLLLITREVIKKFRAEPHFLSSDQPALSNPISFIWKDSLELLEKCFEKEDKETRGQVEGIIKLLGAMGVDVLINVLMESDNRSVRKTAVDTLIEMGDVAFNAIIAILEDAENPWYLYRNALVVLAQLGNPRAVDTVTRLLNHSNPRVREEALSTLVVLRGESTEPKIARALADPDVGVRRRAVSCIGRLRLHSSRIIRDLVEILSQDPGKDPDEKQKFILLKVEAVNSLTAIGNVPVDQDSRVEDLFLDLLLSEKKWSKKLFKRVRLSSGDEEQEKAIQDAALRGLWKIGTKKVIKGLEAFSEKSEKSLALKANEAIKQIRSRSETKAESA